MELESNPSDSESDAGPGISGAKSSGSASSGLDHELAHTIKLRSRPNEVHGKVGPGRSDFPVSTVKMLAHREGNYSGRGRFSTADCCHVSSRFLPVNGPWLVDQMNSRVYVSQFSVDGTLFVAGYQGSHVRIYNVEKGWKLQKNILAKSLQWTITDTCLSSDQRYLVYASMSPVVHIVNVGSSETESYANVTEIHEGLDFTDNEERSAFSIFSLKFSTDGKEVVAGTSNNSICIFDLNANKLSLRIAAHTIDVNTVCFADDSGHLIYSGSDDALCKVWDRRCFRTTGKPAGILMGHLEGITFIDSKGDGRYFISNGKDQCIKLWDIRKMSFNVPSNHVRTYRSYDWDYRWADYPPEAEEAKHPCDQSIFTYKGHSVLRTLIRCYFSPANSTGQKYIYTGSHDASVHVYDLISGAQVATLKHHKSPVRDCSWHPYYPTLVSSSWDGDVVKWEFSGSGEAPIPVKKRIRRRHHFL